MKKILLTTTALVMTAGVAAADVTFSGKAELTYGNWGTEGAGAEGWGATTDLGVSMSGEASGVAYTAGLTIDETDADVNNNTTAADDSVNISGAISLSASGLSLSYEDGGELDAGESDDETGDLKIAYAGSGVSVAYVENVANGASKIDLGYTMGDFSVTYSTNSTDKTSGGAQVNTIGATFAAGDLTVAVSGNDGKIGAATSAAWDASVGYVIGASTVTLATDETSTTAISVATSLNDVTLSAKAKEGDNELSVGYTMGDITMSYAYDEGADNTGADSDGDDAETIISISYDLGGIKITGQSNNRDEIEVAAAFTF